MRKRSSQHFIYSKPKISEPDSIYLTNNTHTVSLNPEEEMSGMFRKYLNNCYIYAASKVLQNKFADVLYLYSRTQLVRTPPGSGKSTYYP